MCLWELPITPDIRGSNRPILEGPEQVACPGDPPAFPSLLGSPTETSRVSGGTRLGRSPLCPPLRPGSGPLTHRPATLCAQGQCVRAAGQALLVPGPRDAGGRRASAPRGGRPRGEGTGAPVGLRKWGSPPAPSRGPRRGDGAREGVQGRPWKGRLGARGRSGLGSSGRVDPDCRLGQWMVGRQPHASGCLGAPVSDTLPHVKWPV